MPPELARKSTSSQAYKHFIWTNIPQARNIFDRIDSIPFSYQILLAKQQINLKPNHRKYDRVKHIGSCNCITKYQFKIGVQNHTYSRKDKLDLAINIIYVPQSGCRYLKREDIYL